MEPRVRLIFLKCCCEIYPFTILCWVVRIRIKTRSPTNFQSTLDNVFVTFTRNNFIVWNYSFSGQNSIYLFSNDNSRIKCKICSKLTIELPDVVLASLFFTLIIFDILLGCLFCWFWTCKCWMEYFIALTLIWVGGGVILLHTVGFPLITQKW